MRGAAVVIAAIVGTLATPSTANARGSIAVTLAGTATTDKGMGTTCTSSTTTPPNLTDNTTTPGTKTCPRDIATHPQNALNKKGHATTVNGNTRTGTATTTTCTATEATVGKQNKPTNATDTNCTGTATFVITGYCNEFTIIGFGTLAANGQQVQFNYTGMGTGGQVTIRGNWWKGAQTKPPTPEGDLTATLTVTEDRTNPASGTCANKTATKFNVTGTAAFVNPKAT